MAETTNNVAADEVIVNDSIDLHDAPHTIYEVARESLSTIPEKTDEEIYAVPVEKEDTEEEKPDPEDGAKEE